jgi:hypothetical protein
MTENETGPRGDYLVTVNLSGTQTALLSAG